MRVGQLLLAATVKTVLASALYSNSFGVPGINATFDYVVIGGGTTGLTIVARLAEDPDVSVAVIEAGGFYQQDNGDGRCVVTIIQTPLDRGSPLTLYQCHTRLVHNTIRRL